MFEVEVKADSKANAEPCRDCWRRGIVINPPSGPSCLNCRGRSAPLLKFGTSFRREGKPQGCRAPLCKFGIEKDVERSDLAIANNDDIQSGVVWGLAFRA